MLGEAIDLARFVSKHWKSEREGSTVIMPGLDTTGTKLTPAIGQELRVLHDMGQQTNTEYLLATDAKTGAGNVDRAASFVREMDAALAFLFDDGIEDDRDAKLARIRQAHASAGDSMDAVALELDDYAGLAKQHEGELDGLGDFDVSIIHDAHALARTLRDQPPHAEASGAARDALARRNRVLSVLQQRMNLVRSAARFVFRHHPEIAREATSSHERARRQRNRAKPAPLPAATTPQP